MNDVRLLVCARLTALAAAMCCAPAASAQTAPSPRVPLLAAAQFSADHPLDERPFNQLTFVSAPGAGDPLRGPSGLIIFDAISGCTTLRSFGGAPAAILDDMSFAPGPAAGNGAVVTGFDFYVRTWGPQPRITVRLTFFDDVNAAGSGTPPIVQHTLASQQFLVIENASVNLASPPGSYLISASLAPFVLQGAEFALEVAFVDDVGEIILNGPLSTVFPGNPCVLTQPVIGSSQERFWIDNDFGNLTGDGIRYEPPMPAMPGNQGDELVWGGALPGDNVLAVRLRGFPIEPNIGACCDPAEPFACALLTPTDCALSGGLFVGLGSPCTPVFLCVPPPPNDACESATIISGQGQFPFDTRGAASNGPDDCRVDFPPFSINSDVWFLWTAPCDGQFQLATCGLSLTDDRVAVYAGSCENFESFGCDDNTCPSGFQSWLALDALAGTQYLIRIGAFPNTPGGLGAINISLINGPCASPCALDFDSDGDIGVPDIFAFLTAWFALQPEAWFYGGSEGGVPSIFAYLTEWFAHGIGPC